MANTKRIAIPVFLALTIILSLNGAFSVAQAVNSNCPGGGSNCVIYQCSDGIDNDGDTFKDFPNDPGCVSLFDNSEFPINNPNSDPCTDECCSGDCDPDPCHSGNCNPPQTPECRDGRDNDHDGKVDMNDPGCSHPDDDNEFNPCQSGCCSGNCNPSPTPECRDGRDNDNDGFVDMNDPGCSHPDDDSEDPFNGGSGSLRVSCEVSDTRVETDERVTFEADISGGVAPYDIDWNGDINGDDDEEDVRFRREGDYEVEVEVRDAAGNRADDECQEVHVSDDGDDDNGSGNDNRPRIISSPNVLAFRGQIYSYDVNAVDQDGDNIHYSLVQGPNGMSINPSTGLIQWLANGGSASHSHLVSVRASDNDGSDTQTYSVFVRASNTNVIHVPGPTRTVFVNTAAVADLDIFDLRVENDENLNVIVSFQTTIPAQGSVHYSLSSHVDDEEQGLSAYEFRRDGFGPSTFHQINLGQLEMHTTYYMKAHAVAGSQTDTTGELGFVQLPTGVIFGTTDDDDDAFASALATIGGFLISPWFLLLIIIILLIVFLMRRSAGPSQVHTSGPVEIRS